jgi:hypothetical protein
MDADELARAQLRELLIDSVPGPDWALGESMFARTFAADRTTSASEDLLPPPQVFGDTSPVTGTHGGSDTGTDMSGTSHDGQEHGHDGLDHPAWGDDHEGGWSVDDEIHPADGVGTGSDAPEASGWVDGYADGGTDTGGLDAHGSVW